MRMGKSVSVSSRQKKGVCPSFLRRLNVMSSPNQAEVVAAIARAEIGLVIDLVDDFLSYS